MSSLSWTRIPISGINGSILDRSSHSLVVVGSKAYLYGGENVPRTPVDDELYIIDLNDGSTTTSSSKTRPSPRVGSFLTAHDGHLYLWGGRESKEMTPCDARLWVYDIARDEWTQGSAEGTSNAPEERSYHCMAVSGDQLFLHAGCPAKGRLDTLHSINLPISSSSEWQTLPAAPAPGRGGTVLCPLTLPSGEQVLVRYGGFAGYEIGSTLDVYDIAAKGWKAVELGDGAPEARSVHALVPFTSTTDPSLVALMFFGERDPAPVELGHDGAGKFHDDVWALRYLAGEGIASGFSFEKVVVEGERPEPRGWFAAGVWSDGARDRAVVYGGLNGKNERLGDLWIADVNKA